MSGLQLYLAIGIPSFTVLLSMIVNGFLFQALSARITALEGRMTGLESRIELRIGSLESTINTRFDMVMGMLSER